MSRDALVVGISTYNHLPPLAAPATDAEAIAQRLEQDGEFQVRRLPEAIKTDQGSKKPVVGKTLDVSQPQLEQALEQLFLPNSSQAPEVALFYFSGHGIPDNKGYDKGYLATSDTDPRSPRSGLSLRWLQWLLSESPVKQQIVWLDCCHSGSLLVNLGAANPGNSESRDRCFIASSRDFESSWEDLNSPYSILTKALLEGLDPTRLPGRWIDTFALADYINQALKGELQTPICTNFGEAIQLTRTWQAPDRAPADSQTDSGICPYKGLEFFDCNEEDPKYFLGRDRLIGQLLDHVRTTNFLALVGASGNGKSSVLRAGLLHQLQRGRRIVGSDSWRIRITRPDRTPMQNLALAFVDAGLSDLDRAEALGRATGLLSKGASGLQRLVQASTATRVILVIDQFEEVFTRCESAEERDQFFACLMGALSSTNDKLCLIIAMRADFIGKCFEQPYSGLAQQIQQHLINVLPMEPEELKAAICQPAAQVGLAIEPALVTEMLNDIAGAPGSLPLLQYTLKELWQQRQGNHLVLSAYQAWGGINGTLDRRATEIYNSFDPAEQQTVQHIFQQLTQLGEGTEDTRRRVFQADLVAEPQHPAAQVQTVIDRLSSPENRLLVTSEVVSKGNQPKRMAIVDVAHEALIRHWKLLQQWIEQNRDLLRQQRKIEASAVAWRDQEQKPGYLLQGLPLTEATHFDKQQRDRFPLSDPAREFVKRSLCHRRNTRLKFIAIGLIAPLGLASYAGIQIAEYWKLRPHWEIVYSHSAKNPVENAILTRALEEINRARRSLRDINLSYADLIDANLRSADLSYADLSSAKLIDVNLIDANLIDADLHSADLSYADLINANLSSANLSSAYLRSAYLRSADLSSADLRSAYLIDAYLIDANLSSANLSSAYLSDAVLLGTTLFSANLLDATFLNSILLSTDFRGTQNLRIEQLTGKEPPLLCNVAIPSTITNVDPNRDCDRMPQVLAERYSISPEEAAKLVSDARQKNWD